MSAAGTPIILCSVCNKEPSVGVACVPGCPVSMSYCRGCLQANAHPWGILVANTACLGGLAHAAEYWIKMVDDTCKHLGKTRAEFDAAVKASMEGMQWGLP